MLRADDLFAADLFGDCENTSDVKQRATCFSRTAQAHGLREEGAERLRILLQAEPGDAYGRLTLGRLEMDTGSTTIAAGTLALAASLFQSQGDAYYETYARLNRGECLRIDNRLGEADLELGEAVRAARDAGDPALVAQSELVRLRLQADRGQDLEGLRQRLLSFRQEHLAEDDRDSNYGILRSWYFQMGKVATRLRRHREAVDLYRRWVSAARLRENRSDEATARASWAAALSEAPWSPSSRVEVLESAQENLEFARVHKLRFVEIESLRLLGMMTPGPEGRGFLQSCLELAPPLSDARRQCLFALAGSLATDARDEQQKREALETLNQALILAGKSEDPWATIFGWSERFRVTWGLLDRPAALEDSLGVLDFLESLRNLQYSEQGRTDFFEHWIEVYQALIGCLLSVPGGPSNAELEAAFEVSERMRGRVFLESVRQTESDELSNLEYCRLDLGEMVNLHRRLQDPSGSREEKQGLQDELDRTKWRVTTECPSIGRRFLDFLDGDQGSKFAGLLDVQEALASDQAFLVFQLAPDRDIFGKEAGGSWLTVLTQADAFAVRLESGPKLTSKLEMLFGLIDAEQVDAETLETVTGALYDDLLAQARDRLPKHIRRWIVAPEGMLHLLPFSLLAPDLEWSVVPSATLWLHWRAEGSPEGPEGALAFADPELGTVLVEPVGGRGVGGRGEIGVASLDRSLGPLPFARDEGEHLVRRLAAPSRLLMGADATESALKKESLQSFRVIHFATHAVVDSTRPHLSAVLLAPGEGEDGELRPDEIVELNLEGHLVVLSTCHSASGRARLGEGVEGLARAFFVAGARTVVANLWPWPDEDASELFSLFYDDLARGKSVAQAAQEARNRRRQDGAPIMAWAGIVVLGDGDWRPLTPIHGPLAGRGWFLALVACLASLGGLGAWMLRRRQKTVRA